MHNHCFYKQKGSQDCGNIDKSIFIHLKYYCFYQFLYLINNQMNFFLLSLLLFIIGTFESKIGWKRVKTNDFGAKNEENGGRTKIKITRM